MRIESEIRRGRVSIGPSPGFSLVETLIALSMLAAALIAIAGLSVTAMRLLDSGRRQSAALLVARGVLEEIVGWGFDQTWQRLGLDGGADLYTLDARSGPHGARWQAQLDAAFRGGHLEVTLAAVAPAGVAALAEAEAVRVVVSVRWSEGLRRRRLRIVAVRA